MRNSRASRDWNPFFPIIVVALLFFLAPLFAHSQTRPMALLNVRVQDVMGGIIAQPADVEILQGRIPIRKAVTDPDGRCTFLFLAEGFYTLRVRLSGFETEEMHVTLYSGREETVTVYLRPDKQFQQGRVPPRGEQTVSVQWLAASKKAREEVLKARELRQREDWEGAIHRLRKALAEEPTFAIAYNDLGLAYLGLKKYPEAREAFEMAIRHDPKFFVAYLNLAQAWIQEKEFRNAAEELQRASRVEPRRGEPYYLMAKIHFELGLVDRAEQAALEALARDHRQATPAHLVLANVYFNQGKTAMAIEQCHKYLEDAPEGEFAAATRAVLAKFTGNGEGAAAPEGAPSPP